MCYQYFGFEKICNQKVHKNVAMIAASIIPLGLRISTEFTGFYAKNNA
jgi:hypothetical protein